MAAPAAARGRLRGHRPRGRAEYDDRAEIDLAELGPLVAKPHNPDNVVPVEEVAGTPVEQVCIGSSVNSAYVDLALPGAILADKDGQVVSERCTATATPGSRQILVAIAESGVYRQLVEGGVRMLEPVCGPCVGMGQAPPSDANSLRTFNRNFQGRSGTPEDPVYLARLRWRRSRCCTARSATRASTATRPEILEMPELKPYVDDAHIFRPGLEEEAESIEIPRGPNIKEPPEHVPMEDSITAKIATIQEDNISTGDLGPDGVIVSYRSNIPAIAEYTFQHRDLEFRKRMQEWGRASSSAATTTARARRASTPRWRRSSSGSPGRRSSPSRSPASTAATLWPRASSPDLQGRVGLRPRRGGPGVEPAEREAGARGGGRRDNRADRGIRRRVQGRARLRTQGARDPGPGGLLHYLRERREAAVA